jgi:hypothetical protein
MAGDGGVSGDEGGRGTVVNGRTEGGGGEAGRKEKARESP